MEPLPIVLQILWTVVSLVFFAGVLRWVLRARSQPDFEAASRLPFADDRDASGKEAGDE
jgi:cbb3-type cytochrome oxidase subunit 3